MKLLTVNQAAESLSVSKSLVYQLVSRGELPYVTVGTAKGYRFDPDDILAFVQQRKKQNGGKKQTASRPRLKHIKL